MYTALQIYAALLLVPAQHTHCTLIRMSNAYILDMDSCSTFLISISILCFVSITWHLLYEAV